MSADQLNQTAAAKALGVTIADIKQWVDAGMPFVDGGTSYRNRYVLADVFRWHQDKLKSGAEAEMTATEAKRRREVALALKAELELAVSREQLVVIDDLMAEFQSALINVRAGLVSMPSRISGLLSHQDEDTISEKLDVEISDLLEHLSKYEHECRDSYNG
ncbi:terminase small subunit [Shewanella sp. phage 1/44]|uniref:terminase small subunit n=1 Tax=Shewanella sp. phage 1/44 TaxID=1458862 RepID=UPI0004F8FF90|nr:terminase small subunit [Shewanella sp. phage 1/44]AHK11733.1 terminase small subunit [Shewanella sp. phage 1/44]